MKCSRYYLEKCLLVLILPHIIEGIVLRTVWDGDNTVVKKCDVFLGAAVVND